MDNRTLKFMKENYMKIMQDRPAQVSKAQSSNDVPRQPSESPVIVPENTVEEVTVTLGVLKLNHFPSQYRDFQGKDGEIMIMTILNA